MDHLLTILDILLRVLALLAGSALVFYTISTAVRFFVLPRAQNVWLNRQIYRYTYRIFLFFVNRKPTYERRDRILAYFAPVVLVLTPLFYLALLIIGYTPIYWALGIGSWWDAFLQAGSSLLTLGYAPVAEENVFIVLTSFTDAAIGLLLVALLIAYLPTIYSAFSQREKMVAMLEVRAGSPPEASIFLRRVWRNRGDLSFLEQEWSEWEKWFSEIEENHTSLIVLVFLRSPQPDRSWITAAGAVLDAAAMTDAVVDIPRQVSSVMCIRAGFIALRRITDFFRIPYDPDPQPDDPISITREEFDEVVEELRAAGLPIKADLDQAWRDFAGWRVNYDAPLVALARLIQAPYAPWSSDRSLPGGRPIWLEADPGGSTD